MEDMKDGEAAGGGVVGVGGGGGVGRSFAAGDLDGDGDFGEVICLIVCSNTGEKRARIEKKKRAQTKKNLLYTTLGNMLC